MFQTANFFNLTWHSRQLDCCTKVLTSILLVVVREQLQATVNPYQKECTIGDHKVEKGKETL